MPWRYDFPQSNRHPRRQKRSGVTCAAMIAPIIYLRVHDEPEERDRQLHGENDRREPAEGRHAGILVEGRAVRQCFRIPIAQEVGHGGHKQGGD